VSNKSWSTPTTHAEMVARAGGRRSYNAQRHATAVARRIEVLRLFHRYGPGHGVQARIARELGVHRSTITRDWQALAYPHERPCPTCSTMVSNKEWVALAAEEGIGIDPLSEDGQQDIWAVEAIRDNLPAILGELGFFVDEDTELITHPDIPGVAEEGITARDLASKVVAEAMRV
jgi:hypothetical protein